MGADAIKVDETRSEAVARHVSLEGLPAELAKSAGSAVPCIAMKPVPPALPCRALLELSACSLPSAPPTPLLLLQLLCCSSTSAPASRRAAWPALCTCRCTPPRGICRYGTLCDDPVAVSTDTFAGLQSTPISFTAKTVLGTSNCARSNSVATDRRVQRQRAAHLRETERRCQRRPQRGDACGSGCLPNGNCQHRCSTASQQKTDR
mmetsp:Transcript_53101/g.88164  ORF Transcript_53101/g.88164 Transcript_53101/m.88164 type:complete len:206 (+) Transcript_53101:308-925(+)